MAPSKIQITTAGAPITPCATSPQLMPFHIAYSGPAPIATFFRVRELQEVLPSAPSSSTSSSLSSQANQEERNTVVNGEGPSSAESKPNVVKRLVAAFRGRRVVGTEVPLPEGYTGLVLRSDNSGNGTQQISHMDGLDGMSKKKKIVNERKAFARGSRRSKPVEVCDEDPEVDESPVDMMDLDGTGMEQEVKTLRATQTFQSLVVWNADVAVDEGQDEYVRALREWTAIAAEVHRMED